MLYFFILIMFSQMLLSSIVPTVLAASFVTGLMTFLALALPLTNPAWYDSIYMKQTRI